VQVGAVVGVKVDELRTVLKDDGDDGVLNHLTELDVLERLEAEKKEVVFFGNVHNNHRILIDHFWIDQKLLYDIYQIIHPLLNLIKNIIL